jgi:hypothetical protein
MSSKYKINDKKVTSRRNCFAVHFGGKENFVIVIYAPNLEYLKELDNSIIIENNVFEKLIYHYNESKSVYNIFHYMQINADNNDYMHIYIDSDNLTDFEIDYFKNKFSNNLNYYVKHMNNLKMKPFLDSSKIHRMSICDNIYTSLLSPCFSTKDELKAFCVFMITILKIDIKIMYKYYKMCLKTNETVTIELDKIKPELLNTIKLLYQDKNTNCTDMIRLYLREAYQAFLQERKMALLQNRYSL